MQLAAAARALPRDDYRDWLSADLVRIHAEHRTTGKRVTHVDKAANHFRDLARFFPLAGTTLDDAMRVAQAVSRSTAHMPFRRDPDRNGFGYASAIAVLQASDGAYWGTVLGTGPGREGLPVFDRSFPYTRIITAEALHEDVRALVGGEDQLRFPH